MQTLERPTVGRHRYRRALPLDLPDETATVTHYHPYNRRRRETKGNTLYSPSHAKPAAPVESLFPARIVESASSDIAVPSQQATPYTTRRERRRAANRVSRANIGAFTGIVGVGGLGYHATEKVIELAGRLGVPASVTSVAHEADYLPWAGAAIAASTIGVLAATALDSIGNQADRRHEETFAVYEDTPLAHDEELPFTDSIFIEERVEYSF